MATKQEIIEINNEELETMGSGKNV